MSLKYYAYWDVCDCKKKSKKKLLHALKMKYNEKLRLWANNCARTWEKQAKKNIFILYTMTQTQNASASQATTTLFGVLCIANYAQSKMKNACITDLERWTVKIQQKNIQWIVEWVLRTFVQNKLKFEKKRKHSHNDRGKMDRNEWQRSLLNNWLHKAAQFLFWII